MKKIAGLVLAFGLILTIPVRELYAQNSFEGTLIWNLTIPLLGDDTHTMIINVKGDKSQINMDMGDQGGLMKIYTDVSKKKRYIVMADNTGMMSDITDDSIASNTQNDSLNMKPTGKKATIAGHPSEEYISSGTNGEVSLWVTADFPKDVRESFYRGLSNSPGQDAKGIREIKYLSDRGLVPVRIVVKVGDEPMMNVEFVKYDRKKLDDSLFVVPTDIKYNAMPTDDGDATN
jgi:hypothetical protein